MERQHNQNHSGQSRFYGAQACNKSSSSKIQASAKGRTVKRGVRYPHWRDPNDKWIIEEDAHEPIVSKELWNQVNEFSRVYPEPKSNQHTVESD